MSNITILTNELKVRVRMLLDKTSSKISLGREINEPNVKLSLYYINLNLISYDADKIKVITDYANENNITSYTDEN